MNMQELDVQLKRGREIGFIFQNAHYYIAQRNGGFILVEIVGTQEIDRSMRTSNCEAFIRDTEIMGLPLSTIFSSCHEDVKQLTIY